jgi:hypothetical protein
LARRRASEQGAAGSRAGIGFKGSRRTVEAYRSELLEAKALVAELKWQLALRRFARKYRPDQPRVPAGNPDGGQWTSEGGGPRDDPRVISDVTPDDVFRPGTQLAQKTGIPAFRLICSKRDSLAAMRLNRMWEKATSRS